MPCFGEEKKFQVQWVPFDNRSA